MFHHRRALGAVRAPFVTAGVAYSGPGDVVGSALGWWGLRAYTSASIGANAVRLRESGGSTQQDFVTIAGGGLDIAAITTFKGANNLSVVTLYDQSGNGKHLTQATASQQPSFVLGVLSSKPVVRLVGASNHSLGGAAIAQAQPLIISGVMKDTGGAGASDYYILGDSNCALGGKSTGSLLDLYAGTEATTAMSVNTFHAVQGVFSGSASDGYIDGVSHTLNPNTGGVSTVRISAIFSTFWDGDFTELGIWAGPAWNSTQKSNMNSNQHTYWGF